MTVIHTAIVTGANHGIGAATARALAGRGCAVLCTYLRVEDPVDPGMPSEYRVNRARDAADVIARVEQDGGTAAAVEADLPNPATPALLFDSAEQRFGPVDILVNNATGWLADSFAAAATDRVGRTLQPVSAAGWTRQFSVDAMGAALIIGEFARRHIARGASWGRIIWTGSGGAPTQGRDPRLLNQRPDPTSEGLGMPNPSVLRALRTARTMRTAVFRPPWVESGHFYSPMTAPADAERAAAWAENVPSAFPGVDISADQQLVFASKLANSLNEPLPGPRYYPDNSQFGPADGAVYRAILNELRPARVVEVGSGFSTAVLLDEADHSQLDVEVTCIEPYPQRLLGLMRDSDRERVTLHRKPVQDVPLDVYNQLGSGDILFIDSTHVVKAGSDVNWLFLRVLPQLNEGVVVHIHDIFWPFEYPKTWLCERRDWTEDYLLHAFLIGNDSWRIMLFSSWLWKNHPELVPDHLRGREPASIWLRRVNNLAVDVTPIVRAAVEARCPRPPH